MRDALPEIRRRGADLVVIGSGRPWLAKAFQQEQGIDFPLLTDPDLIAYKAAGLQRSRAALLKPKVVGAGIRAYKDGFRQTAVAGDPWQNGGVFVIRPPGHVLFEQRSDSPGDHADPAAVLAALDAAGR